MSSEQNGSVDVQMSDNNRPPTVDSTIPQDGPNNATEANENTKSNDKISLVTADNITREIQMNGTFDKWRADVQKELEQSVICLFQIYYLYIH